MLKDMPYPGEEVEGIVSSIVDSSVRASLKAGYDVVLDNTHCNAKHLKETIAKFGKEARIVLKVIGSELSMKQIKAQNLNRTKVVPEEVIDRMYDGFKHIVQNKKEFQQQIDELAAEAYTATEPIKQDEALEKVIIVDIDGTVAHMEGKRSPFDWQKVHLDSPDQKVLGLVRGLSEKYKVIFMSGRDEEARDLTTLWLQQHYKNEEITLFMRPHKDYRKDSIVKLELYNQHIKDKYYVQAVFDDRDQVVKMWRDLGLTCAQVGYGNF